jgi:hypothetical protein
MFFLRSIAKADGKSRTLNISHSKQTEKVAQTTGSVVLGLEMS